ncbi:MAG TPA: hypothetical protein VGO16_14925 [Pseudonocardiaceae bacterium]|jgi:hypothetical protein|nr:hypothetical protein [Pseudonocardiaceae bacterium]
MLSRMVFSRSSDVFAQLALTRVVADFSLKSAVGSAGGGVGHVGEDGLRHRIELCCGARVHW